MTKRTLPVAAVALLVTSCSNPFAVDQAGGSADMFTDATAHAEPKNGGEQENSSSDEDQDAEDDDNTEAAGDISIPDHWLADTAADWPDAEGFGGYVPHSAPDDECLLFDQVPDFVGLDADFSRAAWAGYGESAQDHDAYLHMCMFRAPDNYAGNLTLIQVNNEADAEYTIEDFMNQPDIPEQDNETDTVEVDGVQMYTHERWYPTNNNPHGQYRALFYDQDAMALMILEVNSLRGDNWENYSQEQVAEDLVEVLREG